ncbi:MAG: phosphatidate cytidylyltransferase [Firmicutes bacterium]|nr:phosphatidate cytidylyltransferase [Bacillota bacterium]
MKTRILSGLIMVPLLAVLYFGGEVLRIACFIIGIAGLYEFMKGFKSMDIKPSYPIGCVFALLLYGIDTLRIWSGVYRPELYMCWLVLLVVCSCLYLFKFDERKLEDGMATIIGVVYIVLFSYHVVLVDQTVHGILVWTIVFSAFGTDIFAYFTGYALGKHKLCPKISPKKTIEGSIGGILGSMLLCGLFGWFVAGGVYFVHTLAIGALGGVISQAGDLTASVFKRKMGIKDYGNLIPGHGGVLDRFDSVLFTAPLVYYYIIFVL